jgi:hypothetical protein
LYLISYFTIVTNIASRSSNDKISHISALLGPSGHSSYYTREALNIRQENEYCLIMNILPFINETSEKFQQRLKSHPMSEQIRMNENINGLLFSEVRLPQHSTFIHLIEQIGQKLEQSALS